MNSRKRKVVVAALAGTIVLVTAIGATAFVVIRNQQRHDDVAAATKVAKTYTTKLKAYRDAIWTAVLVPGAASPIATKAALVKARKVDPPRLGNAPAWGRSHSKAYVAAAAAEKDVEQPYDRFERLLDDSIPGELFIEAAQAAQDFDPEDAVKSGVEISGTQFGAKMVPAIEKATKKFNEVTVPSDAKKAAEAVRASLADTLKQARAVAADLDAGRDGSMEAGDLWDDADTAIFDYQDALEKKVGKGLESIAVR
ncbi:MAG: hypothetical protein QOH68_3116 [Nocardioidaceae bacterium]|jgi:hypothetical protein|nr:hypothetical protein [Nocardioidaceae bacterium]